jgi:hypothetical protein
MSYRLRSKGTIGPASTMHVFERNLGTGSLADVGAVYQTGDRTTTGDFVTPNYRKRSAKGEVIMNPYSSTTNRQTSHGGSPYVLTSLSNPTQGYAGEHSRFFEPWMSQALNGPPPIRDILSGELIGRMTNECATRVSSERGRSQNNLWESLAEIDQTIGLLKNPLGAFQKFYNRNLTKVARKRNNPDAPREAAEAAANAWLQVQYGLKPLINDVNAILKGIKKANRTSRVTTRASLSENAQEIELVQFRRSGFNFDVRIQYSDTIVIRAMSLDEVYDDIGSNIGFTSKGLITLPWELIPYSFVADWFVNTGEFLGALAPAFTTKQLGSCIVTRRVQSSDAILENNFLDGGFASSFSLDVPMSGGFSCYRNTTSRTAGLPAPVLQLKHGNPFKSVERAISGLALAYQQVNGIFGNNGRLPRR